MTNCSTCRLLEKVVAVWLLILRFVKSYVLIPIGKSCLLSDVYRGFLYSFQAISLETILK